jgi:hypothetical protein
MYGEAMTSHSMTSRTDELNDNISTLGNCAGCPPGELKRIEIDESTDAITVCERETL